MFKNINKLKISISKITRYKLKYAETTYFKASVWKRVNKIYYCNCKLVNV